jgi:hypothetical protein
MRGAPLAALALVVAMVMLASAVQARRLYVYCPVMQTVMSHACCARATHQSNAGAVVAKPCCETRDAAALTLFVPAPRDSDLSAPSLVLASESLTTQPFTTGARQSHVVRPTLRAPPPKLRVHLLLMILHV